MKIEGVIFDLDGTILDSTWVWKQVDVDFLGKYGIQVPDDYSDAIKAMGFEQVAEYTIARFRLPLNAGEVMAGVFREGEAPTGHNGAAVVAAGAGHPHGSRHLEYGSPL